MFVDFRPFKPRILSSAEFVTDPLCNIPMLLLSYGPSPSIWGNNSICLYQFSLKDL